MKAKVTYTFKGEENFIDFEGTKKSIERGVREIENIVPDIYVDWEQELHP